MPVFREKDIKAREIFPGVNLIQAIQYENGSQAVTMGKIVIEPGCEIPPHTHPVDDCMIILEGSGALYTETGDFPAQSNSSFNYIYYTPCKSKIATIRMVFGRN